MDKEIRRARRIPREDTLCDHSGTPRVNKRVPLVITCHPRLPNIGEILHGLHPVLQSSKRCAKAISEVRMVAQRKPKSLRDIIVRAEIKNQIVNKGCHKCGSVRCKVYDYITGHEDTKFTSKVTGWEYVINYELNCNSENVVYLLSCKRCAMQYVGSTTNRFRTRFNNHKSRLNAMRNLSLEARSEEELVYQQFFLGEHRGLDDVKLRIIYKGASEVLLIGKGRPNGRIGSGHSAHWV